MLNWNFKKIELLCIYKNFLSDLYTTTEKVGRVYNSCNSNHNIEIIYSWAIKTSESLYIRYSIYPYLTKKIQKKINKEFRKVLPLWIDRNY